MRFLGSNFTQNALATGAPPRTPLGKLNRSPDPLPISGAAFRQGKGKGARGKREEGKGYWGEKEGRKGREEGREGGKGEGGRRKREGRESLRLWR